MNVFSFTVKMNLREDQRTGLPLKFLHRKSHLVNRDEIYVMLS